MITTFSANDQHNLVKFEAPIEKALWIDVFEPTPEEHLLIEKETGVELPEHHEMHQLEFSNRFYEQRGVFYLSISTVTKAAPLPESHVVTFILSPTQLITLRYSDPNPVKSFMDQTMRRPTAVRDHYEIFSLLLGSMVGRVADLFELIGVETEGIAISLDNTINGALYAESGKVLKSTLGDINKLENLLSKTFQSISSLSLTIGYLQQIKDKIPQGHLYDQFDTFDKDIRNLHNNGDYLNQKLSFQLQSALGVINVQQNQIIKVFTVLAMVFMPPTLIASIYGMNFHHMPELSFTYGYPCALVLMLLSSLLPYRYFKNKGWI